MGDTTRPARFVSFDVANKSLAVAIVCIRHAKEINEQLEVHFAAYNKNKEKYLKNDNMAGLLAEYLKLLKNCNAILSARFRIEYLKVIDLIPGRKVSETSAVERSFLLGQALDALKPHIPLDNCQFLVEYQMGPNDKSRAASAQILLFCTSFMRSAAEASARIKLVGPSLKNKLHIKNDEKSYHAYYLSKFKTNYAANKNHTKYILKKLTAAYGQNDIIENIKKKNIDDAADAVCMAVAYFLYIATES